MVLYPCRHKKPQTGYATEKEGFAWLKPRILYPNIDFRDFTAKQIKLVTVSCRNVHRPSYEKDHVRIANVPKGFINFINL